MHAASVHRRRIGQDPLALPARSCWSSIWCWSNSTAGISTRLDAEQLARFKELLVFPDNDLLDLVMGASAPPDQRYDAVLQLLRAALKRWLQLSSQVQWVDV